MINQNLYIDLYYFSLKFFQNSFAILYVITKSELSSTGNVILHGNHQLYNVSVIAHGLFMVFFVVMLSLLTYIVWIMCCYIIKNK